MKKILLTTIIAITAVFSVADVNAQSFKVSEYGNKQRQSFYYYPVANVYYNVASRKYIYPRNGVWISVAALPFNFRISNTPRYSVYYYGSEIWKDNRTHVANYRTAYLRKRSETAYCNSYYDKDKYKSNERKDNDDYYRK